METYQDLLNAAKEEGSVELRSGVWLETAESLIAQQKDWEEGDGCKEMDFTCAQFWITTDDGETPVSICGVEDLEDFDEGNYYVF